MNIINIAYFCLPILLVFVVINNTSKKLNNVVNKSMSQHRKECST